MLLRLALAIFSLCNAADASVHNDQAQKNFESIADRSLVARNTHRNATPNPMLEFARKLNKVRNVNEFYQLFHPEDLHVGGFLIADRFGGGNLSRGATPPPSASCVAETRSVPVTDSPDPAAFYYPRCVSVRRCGGCCNSELLACRPRASETREYRVYVMKLNGATGSPYIRSVDVVSLEEHTKCECRCRIEAKDCSSRHYYDDAGCSCVCKNAHAEEKCNQQHPIKQWNDATCACECRKVEECSTSFYFNEERCRCERM